MSAILLHHATIVPTTGPSFLGWLLIHEGRIALLGPGDDPFLESAASYQRIDAQGYWLVPGFIDLHVHGAIGHELMDADPDGLRAMAQFYAAHGVTAFLPTTWAASTQALQRALATVDALKGPVPGGATILGVHLEGPYLNPTRCGAQDPQWIRHATPEEALPLLDSGLVRLVALAPEFPENHWLIRECLRRGITVSLAHSAATFDEANAAFTCGISQTTHTFNAMTGLGHREPGAVGAALAHPLVRSELIA
ncbi:MAG: amidohydrolase family protein, partial [Chloroflexi bacterium]|nr:amidohydrolase family protein [Chloroflexota bacterium]